MKKQQKAKKIVELIILAEEEVADLARYEIILSKQDSLSSHEIANLVTETDLRMRGIGFGVSKSKTLAYLTNFCKTVREKIKALQDKDLIKEYEERYVHTDRPRIILNVSAGSLSHYKLHKDYCDQFDFEELIELLKPARRILKFSNEGRK